MNVYETSEGIDTRPAITLPFPTAQPKYASQDPVAIGVTLRKLWRVDFTGWPPPAKNRVQGLALANTRTDVVLASRGATAAIALTGAIERSRYRVLR